MMKYINIILLTVLSVSMAQCSSDEAEPEYPTPDWSAVPEDTADGSPNWIVSQDATVNSPEWSVNLSGSDAAPSWSDPDKSVYPTSMTAVVRLSPVLELFADDADVMAAFIGGECRGVAQSVMVDGVKLFFIQVKAPSSESGNVEFRYFSNRVGRIYKSVASDVAYVINKVYGTADAPEYPNFEQSGKYPCLAKAYVDFDESNQPFAIADGDEIAIFVGDECRSVAHAIDAAKGTYWFNVFGVKEKESFRIKYYSAANKIAYISEQSFEIPANGSVVGSADAPEVLTFVPDGSMTAYLTIGAPLSSYTDSTSDEVAAFADGKCIGKGEYLGNSVYKLVVKGLVADGTNVDVKYYCKNCNYLFTSPACFTFANTSVVGSELQPKSVAMNLTGKHPLKMTACIAPMGMVKDLARNTDKIAAFVGNECRGVGQAKTTESGQLYFMININGSIDGNDVVTLKYYSSVKKQLYVSNVSITFANGSEYGTTFAPIAVEFSR
ncbi:MAG: hypothetical protein ACI4AH_08180 [Muribaculaceae bacterium]